MSLMLSHGAAECRSLTMGAYGDDTAALLAITVDEISTPVLSMELHTF